jgi:hypothetical protein
MRRSTVLSLSLQLAFPGKATPIAFPIKHFKIVLNEGFNYLSLIDYGSVVATQWLNTKLITLGLWVQISALTQRVILGVPCTAQGIYGPLIEFFIRNTNHSFITLNSGACTIKPFTAVIVIT